MRTASPQMTPTMHTSNDDHDPVVDRANVSSQHCYTNILKRLQSKNGTYPAPDWPQTSPERRKCTLDVPRDLDTIKNPKQETFLYLAYGSNLSDEKFLGDRGIRPLSSINVVVPDLRMTFDLPGIPYTEPCFANSARRETAEERECIAIVSEKTPLVQDQEIGHMEYRKDMWKKGMVGVVYEVTASDYATIIATEGGGSSYQDVLVDCYPLADDPTVHVPWQPSSGVFRAHTLFAPATPDNGKPPTDGGRFRRPDPSYAQASSRYLKLITDGAQERKLPFEYQDYLNSLQPYTITSQRQRLGQFVVGMLWIPIIFFILGLQKQLSDENGIAPEWLRRLASAIFRAVWDSYDLFFKGLFGDGERTVERDDEDQKSVFSHHQSLTHKPSLVVETGRTKEQSS